MKLLFQEFYGRFVIERLLYNLNISDLAISFNDEKLVLRFIKVLIEKQPPDVFYENRCS